MGYSILYAATDLDITGIHTQLDRKARTIIDTWVILMPSTYAQASRRASSAQWAQAQATFAATSQQQRSQSVHIRPKAAVNLPQEPLASAALPVQDRGPNPITSAPHFSTSPNVSSVASNVAKSVGEQLDEIEMEFRSFFIPQCQRFTSKPPPDAKTRDYEYRRLTQSLEQSILLKLDTVHISPDDPARNRREDLIIQSQLVIENMDRTLSTFFLPARDAQPGEKYPGGEAGNNITTINELPSGTNPVSASSYELPLSPTVTSVSPPPTSPPPYSPNTPTSAASAGPSFPFPEKKPIRRKAPPPPKKFIAAKALYDFEPEEGNNEELAFIEGDDIEIIEKSATLEEEGWCRARVKGGKKIGLAPLEYLEEVKATGPSRPTNRPPVSGPSQSEANAGDPSSTGPKPNQTHSVDPGTAYAQQPLPNPELLANGGIAADGHYEGLAGLPPPNQQPLPAESYYYGDARPAMPLVVQIQQPAQEKGKVGMRDVADLSIGGIDAAASVAALGSETGAQNAIDTYTPSTSGNPSDPQPQQNQDSQQDPQLQQDQQASQDQNVPDSSIVTIHETVNDNGNENVQYTNQQLPFLGPMDQSMDPAPPGTDLSAFSGSSFIPQEPVPLPNPMTGLATIDPFYTAQNPALASATDFDSAMAVAGMLQSTAATTDMEYTTPFAAAAAPIPTENTFEQAPSVIPTPFASYAAPPTQPDLIQDQPLPVTTFTEQSTESVVDNAGWTQLEADDTTDDVLDDI